MKIRPAFMSGAGRAKAAVHRELSKIHAGLGTAADSFKANPARSGRIAAAALLLTTAAAGIADASGNVAASAPVGSEVLYPVGLGLGIGIAAAGIGIGVGITKFLSRKSS